MRSKTTTILALALLVGTLACSSLTREGILTIFMTSNVDLFLEEDSPFADINAVIVEIVKVEVQDNDGGSFDQVFAGSMQIDLLDISDRQVPIVFNDDVDRDNYHFVRLTLSEEGSEVVDTSGTKFPLSFEFTEVLVPVVFTIEPSESTTILLEIDVGRSLRVDLDRDTFRMWPIISQAIVTDG